MPTSPTPLTPEEREQWREIATRGWDGDYIGSINGLLRALVTIDHWQATAEQWEKWGMERAAERDAAREGMESNAAELHRCVDTLHQAEAERDELAAALRECLPTHHPRCACVNSTIINTPCTCGADDKLAEVEALLERIGGDHE